MLTSSSPPTTFDARPPHPPANDGAVTLDPLTNRSHFYYRDPAAPEPTHRRTLSVIALIERDGALLLERRADAPLWSLIAGMVDDTETLTNALRREVSEETGLTVTSYRLFGTFSDPTRIVSYPDGNVFRVASFVYDVGVASFDDLRPSSESELLRFFPKAELAGLDLAATQRPVVEKVLSGHPPPHLE
jgi:8-oxo-dGTP pyrophosphatase MutT (NUDIX family)